MYVHDAGADPRAITIATIAIDDSAQGTVIFGSPARRRPVTEYVVQSQSITLARRGHGYDAVLAGRTASAIGVRISLSCVDVERY